MAEANLDIIDDIKDDMWTLTEFDADHVQKPRKSCDEKLRIKARAYLTKNDEDEEEIEMCPPVRGRPVGWEKYVPKPGATPTFDAYTKNISQQIREVSGLGYSNEFIRHGLGYETPKNEVFCDAEVEFCRSGDGTNSVPLPLHDIIKTGATKKGTMKISDTKHFPPLH